MGRDERVVALKKNKRIYLNANRKRTREKTSVSTSISITSMQISPESKRVKERQWV